MPELSDSVSERKDTTSSLKISLSDFKPFVGIMDYCSRCPKVSNFEIIKKLKEKETSLDEATSLMNYQFERNSNLGLLTLAHFTGLTIPIYLIGSLANYFK